jgi:hypothetical protein
LPWFALIQEPEILVDWKESELGPHCRMAGDFDILSRIQDEFVMSSVQWSKAFPHGVAFGDDYAVLLHA